MRDGGRILYTLNVIIGTDKVEYGIENVLDIQLECGTTQLAFSVDSAGFANTSAGLGMGAHGRWVALRSPYS